MFKNLKRKINCLLGIHLASNPDGDQDVYCQLCFDYLYSELNTTINSKLRSKCTDYKPWWFIP